MLHYITEAAVSYLWLFQANTWLPDPERTKYLSTWGQKSAIKQHRHMPNVSKHLYAFRNLGFHFILIFPIAQIQHLALQTKVIRKILMIHIVLGCCTLYHISKIRIESSVTMLLVTKLSLCMSRPMMASVCTHMTKRNTDDLLWRNTTVTGTHSKMLTNWKSSLILKKKSCPCNRPWRPIGLWDVKDLTFSRQSAHRWGWGGQPHALATLYPQEDSWYSFLSEAESTPGP
jgi:hypothetical protein